MLVAQPTTYAASATLQQNADDTGNESDELPSDELQSDELPSDEPLPDDPQQPMMQYGSQHHDDNQQNFNKKTR